MFDFVQTIPHRHLHAPALCQHCAPLRAFVEEHRQALIAAGSLLGGPGGARTAQAVVEGLGPTPASPRRLRLDLGSLLDLLTLENVHDETRIEAALFAAIDPASPIVEDLCLLADGLRDAITQWDDLHHDADAARGDWRDAA